MNLAEEERADAGAGVCAVGVGCWGWSWGVCVVRGGRGAFGGVRGVLGVRVWVGGGRGRGVWGSVRAGFVGCVGRPHAGVFLQVQLQRPRRAPSPRMRLINDVPPPPLSRCQWCCCPLLLGCGSRRLIGFRPALRDSVLVPSR